jgi:YVTN family beta-propeller protein
VAPAVIDAPQPAGAATTCVARAFVANGGNDDVSVVDLATDTVVGAPVVVGHGPLGARPRRCR